MNIVKYIFIYYFVLFGVFSSKAQNKIYLGDTSRVSYSLLNSSSSSDVIDSTVFIKGIPYGKLYEPQIVYFDKNETQVAYTSYFRGDSCISIDYWRNGKLKRKDINIKRDSFYIYWYYEELHCENGQLIVKWYPNSTMPNQLKNHWITYYCNGNKKAELNTYNGRPDGLQTFWYENGNIKLTTDYKNVLDTITNKIHQIEKLKYYKENGELDSTQVYDNDKMVKALKN